MFVSLPTGDGLVIGVLGFSHADLDAMKEGQTLAAIDLRANFEVGMAVPSVIQIAVQPTDEDLWQMIYDAAPGSKGKFQAFDTDDER